MSCRVLYSTRPVTKIAGGVACKLATQTMLLHAFHSAHSEAEPSSNIDISYGLKFFQISLQAPKELLATLVYSIVRWK